MRPLHTRQPGEPGFTLIELLVVLVIFGIALGLVAVRLLPDELALARREAQATALLLERASDETESSGHPLAWRPDGAGDRFETLDEAGHWQPLNNDADFHVRGLPGDLHWSALAFAAGDGGNSSSSGVSGAQGSSAVDSARRLVFLPGQAAPEFSIEVQVGRARVQLKGDALGRVAVNTLNDGSGP